MYYSTGGMINFILGSLVKCTICLSTLVIEVEEPKLPEPPLLPEISLSSSQSSIGKKKYIIPRTLICIC